MDAFNEMLARIQSRDNELKKALSAREQALLDAQSARDSLKTTLASIGDAVISTDREGCIVFANRVAQSMLGSNHADLVGKHLDGVFRIVNELSRKPVESPLVRVLRDGATASLADGDVLVSGDGAEIPIDHSGAPIQNESGVLQGAVLVFRDATSRRRAVETARLLASIVESSDDAIVGKDLNGIVTSWNQGAQRIFGYTSEEMIGHPIAIIAAPGYVDEMPEILQRIARGERIQQYHALRRTKAGKLIHVSITVSPVRDALGRIVGASKIARDVTEQVLAAERLATLNADLRESNENLARSNEDLERFAFVASHDLQEPLRMITVYTQLLMSKYQAAPDSKTASYVENVVGGARRMRELLSDLLAYTEIGARAEAPAEPVDLNEVMAKVRQSLKLAIDDSGAVITCDPLPTLNAYESHLIQLFQNLIGNALKYRRDDPPRVHISVSEDAGQITFTVSDNGIGVDPVYHQKIFGAFKRLHGKKIPGTGIGLAICQRVVERYGGRIWVESKVGEGSKFMFTLPRDPADGREG